MEDLHLEAMGFMESYENQLEAIQTATQELLQGSSILDPLYMAIANAVRFEKPEDFLARTLLTGSDNAELTMAQISDFASMNLELKYPT